MCPLFSMHLSEEELLQCQPDIHLQMFMITDYGIAFDLVISH